MEIYYSCVIGVSCDLTSVSYVAGRNVTCAVTECSEVEEELGLVTVQCAELGLETKHLFPLPK